MAWPPSREPAEWVVRRPLRTPGTEPGTPTPFPPSTSKPSERNGLSSPPDHPPPLVGVQLVRPRPAPPSRGLRAPPAGLLPRDGRSWQLRGKIPKNSQPTTPTINRKVIGSGPYAP